MDPARFETLDPKVAEKLVNPETFGRAKEKADKTRGSMWMGIFNSPVVKGMRRHVDIKFYPYSERVYATLYFTGNGYFNRSMRLWAKENKKYKLKLSDHGFSPRWGFQCCRTPTQRRRFSTTWASNGRNLTNEITLMMFRARHLENKWPCWRWTFPRKTKSALFCAIDVP